jgi:hypothetical protein
MSRRAHFQLGDKNSLLLQMYGEKVEEVQVCVSGIATVDCAGASPGFD